MRLDFFGDEIESIRRFSTEDQRTIDRVDHFDLLPAVEALMDEDSIRRFRTSYRDLYGVTATADPLYQAVSDGRRLSGMDHWLPLFEERMGTLFDHLGDNLLVLRDGGTAAAAQQRLDAIAAETLGLLHGQFRVLDHFLRRFMRCRPAQQAD